MSIYKITYYFSTATPNKNSFNDVTVKADNVEDALIQWEKYATKFVLENLVYVECTVLGYDAYGHHNNIWHVVKTTAAQKAIETFIAKHKTT